MQPQPARLGGAATTRRKRALGIGMVARPGGHLQADSSGGRQRTGGKRGLAGLREPVERTATDQVDGAQLMQDPDTPEGEIVLIGQAQGGREGLFGRGKVTLAFTLAQHLQRLAGLLVAPAHLRVPNAIRANAAASSR